MKLIILGPPGSGKGTISELLCTKFRLFHISPGEILREEVKKETTIGREIKKYIDTGHLVPSQLVVEFVKLEIQRRKNYILDGFPRTVEQAEAIQDWNIDHVLYLDLDQEAVVRRLSGRRVCTKGIHNYHLTFLPPQNLGRCDIDGSPLLQREDDQPAVIKERFKVFTVETKPVITYYKQKGLLRTIDASGTPEEVYAKILKIIS